MSHSTDYAINQSISLNDNIKIKKEESNELILDIKPEKEDINEDNPFENIQVEVKHEFITPSCEDDKINYIETDNDSTHIDNDIKMETPYEYPSIDDGSMDSEEASALNNVEACLQEEIDVKNEMFEVSYFVCLILYLACSSICTENLILGH